MGSPVVFLGLDAMDAGLVRAWADAGALPTLAGLLGTCARVPTRGPDGFYVGGVWPSISTGVGPARHGQHCWRQFDPATYLQPPPPYDDGEGVPFWKQLDEAGLRVAVVDVPRTIRVRLAHGVQVHDWGTHDALAPGFVTWPPDLAATLVRRHGPPQSDACNRWPKRRPADVRAFLDRLRDRVERKVALVEDLAGQGPWDLLAVGFGDAHCAGHQLWGLHDAGHRAYDRRIAAAVGDPLREAYRILDEGLGRLLDRVGDPRSPTFVLLSHGVAPHHDGTHLLGPLLERLERHHRPAPPLPWRDRWRRARGHYGTPKQGLRWYFRRFPRRRWLAWFPVENNEAWAGVRLNLQGREAAGRIPAEDRDRWLDVLAAELAALVNPSTGGPAFTAVRRTEDLGQGSRLPLLPDLVAAWDRTAPFDALRSPRVGTVRGRARHVRSGDHRPEGLLLARGPGIAPGDRPGPRPVTDVAPTVCAALGVRLRGVDGRPVPLDPAPEATPRASA